MDKKIKTMLVRRCRAGTGRRSISTVDESTKRYLIHIGKQVPYLPYRYFI